MSENVLNGTLNPTHSLKPQQIVLQIETREQWIQRTTFAADSNTSHSHTQRDAERHNTFAADSNTAHSHTQRDAERHNTFAADSNTAHSHTQRDAKWHNTFSAR